MDENTKESKIGIDYFLNGTNDKSRVVAIEGEYYENEVSLIIDDPDKGTIIEKHTYTPFLFMKNLKNKRNPLYKNDKSAISSAVLKHGIKFTKLRTDNEVRLEEGFSFLVETNKKQGNLNNFFKEGGYIQKFPQDFDDDESSKLDRDFILKYKPAEQFLMSTGIRLFKGFNQYKDIHKFYFDIETTSLRASDGNIFLIGMKTNRGYKKVLEIDLNDPIYSEKKMIIDFFDTIYKLKPHMILGYNSESFDFTFILERARILGVNLGQKDVDGNMQYDVRTSLNANKPIKRQPSTIKFGGETENYEKTIMWGFNVVDIAHSVRATKAINSDIKGWGLKYITKYYNANKPNRMYVDGDKIYTTWFENKTYIINTKNSIYKHIPEKFKGDEDNYLNKVKNWVKSISLLNTEDLKNAHPSLVKLHDDMGGDYESIVLITGKEIVFQYLLDDLDETEVVDEKVSQSNFMVGKIMPTDYIRAITMGNSSKWKMLLSTYYYMTKIAIPVNVPKRDIVGGLSRLLDLGYAKNVLKMDFSSLYPSIQLTHDVFPKYDIVNILKEMLTYFKDSRNENKALSKKYSKMFKESNDPKHEYYANLYDTKQLPIKILNNSNFGALSAPNIFPWGDNNIGCEITCTGRQYLRLMVYHFEKYGFKALVLDTDGVNFSIPDNHENIKYINKEGKEFSGYEAVLEEFNDLYMYGVMKLSLDGMYSATVNISRKNYIDLNSDGSIKLVGNSIKSSKLPEYIEETIDEVVRYLVNGDGESFIEAYYKKLEQIYNMDIPLIKIASKSKMKETIEEYQYNLKTKKKVNGDPINKKVHMELLIEAGLNPSLGTNIYYVNNGKTKSKGDLGNSYLIDERDFISNPNKKGEYNFKRAVEAFNKRMSIFLVCFKQEVRDTLIVDNPSKRAYYTKDQMELINGVPIEPKDQDCLDVDSYIKGMKNVPLLEMEEREVYFWNYSDKDPFKIFDKFTTKMSREKLLNKKEKEVRKIHLQKIKNFFKEKGVIIKDEMDYIVDKDLITRYTKVYRPLRDVVNEKTGKITKEIVEEELPEMTWVLTQDNNNKRVDIDIINKDIYLK